MSWIRRHAVALILTFMMLFNALVIFGGTLAIKHEAEHSVKRQCQTLRRAVNNSDQKWFTLLNYFEDAARRAGRTPSPVLDDIRRLIGETDPITC